MQQPETRPSLIAHLQGAGNDLAWGEFVAAYEPFLRRLIERQGVPERHLADVTQQLLGGVARSVGQWRDDGHPASFRRWLARVARNIALKFMARERRQVAGWGGTDFLEMMDRVPDAALAERERQFEHELVVWAAEQVRGEFRESSWQAFWGTLVEGRPVAELSAELRVSAGSIYMSRSRIMARIRAKVREVTKD
jgi:RNA polymerase sigma-70 factor (ECF subfamily)